jgi:hypothetical protein
VRAYLLVIPALFTLLAAPGPVRPQSAATAGVPPAAPVAASISESPGTPRAVFAPGLDDLMTMLIQPRHLKLYYAGAELNWELAAAESRELGSSFRRLASGIPKYLNRDVDRTVAAMIAPKMKAVDAAISAADAKQFLNAYAELTEACNACHIYMEHPFLVIKVPEGLRDSAHADQVFSPAR